jgi:hypothetical protein
VQILQEIWQSHHDFDHFLSDPNILELALSRVLQLESRPEELESGLRQLLSDICSRLSEDRVAWIDETSRRLLETGSGRVDAYLYLQTLICSLPSRVLSRLEPDIFRALFSVSTADERIVLAIAKIR